MNQAEKIKLKQELKKICINSLEQRILAASEAMKLAQDSANNAEKSSAGDKYETARAMGQLDRDLNARQLDEARRELALLEAIDTGKLYQRITKGAVVVCEQMAFFVACGYGAITHHEKKIMLISPKAPLALVMNGRKVTDHFTFNGKDFEILDVF